MMKIEVFDRIVTGYDDRHAQFEAERMQLILEGLGSLEQFETGYYVFGEDNFSQDVLSQIAEHGMDILPLTYIDGALHQQRDYLSNEEVMALTGIEFEIVDEHEHDHSHDHAHHHHDDLGGCSCGHHH
ncbi:arsenic metallochaperone ArsD family protein [Carnobacteriaceae bacterium zg-C25]|nr:arsenic metallochaperone ArsD family protein [Carnobacteriaceae bacterium zg-C25]